MSHPRSKRLPPGDGGSAKPGMRISLVVCTRNRAAQLAQAMEKFAELTCHEPWEVVLVDNGSTDDTGATIDRYCRTHPQNVSAVVEPRPGLGRARNRGWRASRGEITAFTDDDCYPDPEWLVQLIQCFEEDAQLGFVG